MNGLTIVFGLFVQVEGLIDAAAVEYPESNKIPLVRLRVRKRKKLRKSSPQRDLNSRPLVYKTSALTPELWRHFVT